MADDKDDNGLKKAEEALEKAEQKLALTVEGTPAHKKAAEALVKAKENRLAANFRKGQRTGDSQDPPLIPPPIIDPRGRGGLALPLAPTAPNLGGSGQLAPESMLSNKDTIVDQARAAAPLDTTTLLSNPVTIANQAREGKKTPEEKAANKIKRLAKQAAQKRKDAAAKKAAYNRGVAERARQAKVDTEAERAIRERHDKDKPSAWEMGLADLSGGLLGGVMGTYDRYMDASRAANDEIENFRLKNASDEAIRKALVAAKNTSAGVVAASYGWNASAIKAAGEAKSVLTSNAYDPYLFKEDGENPLNGIGPNENGDSKEKVIGWFHKTFKKASNGNKKAIREIGAASSRIAGLEKRYNQFLEKDLVILDNKNTYENKLYATVPKYGVEASEAMASIDYMWADKASLQKQIETWETLNAYYQMYDMLAANADPEGKYADFAAKWSKVTDDPNSPILKSVQAMTDFAEDLKITITAQQRNLKDVRDAGRRVTDINAQIKGLENNDNHDEAIWLRENELPEAEQDLNLTLLFSGHSDLKATIKDGRLKVSEKPDGESLIVQRLDPVSGKVIYALNEPYISSLPDELQPAARERANRALTLATEHSAFTPPAVIEVDPVGGPLTVTLNEYNEWKNNPKNKKQVAALNRIAESISRKVLSNDEISFEDLLNGDAAGYFSDKENAAMRNRNVRMMILQFKEKADKIK